MALGRHKKTRRPRRAIAFSPWRWGAPLSLSGGDPISLPEVTYAYKPGPGLEQGKIASVAVGGMGGRVVSYEYDAQGRVYTVTAPDGKITTFNARDVLGRVTQMTLPGAAW